MIGINNASGRLDALGAGVGRDRAARIDHGDLAHLAIGVAGRPGLKDVWRYGEAVQHGRATYSENRSRNPSSKNPSGHGSSHCPCLPNLRGVITVAPSKDST